MSQTIERIVLSPEGEAVRLWQGAQDALPRAGESIGFLSETVDLSVRVLEILVGQCLEPVRGEFPATIASLLEPPPPEVDPNRDFVHQPKSLRFVDVLDLLSAMDLTCISPHLHHGWEDPRASCRRSRTRTIKVTGFSVEEKDREDLMLIGAYRNRIFLLPPPVQIVPQEVLDAFPTLVELVERFFALVKGSEN